MIEYTGQVDPGKTRWYLNGKLHREDGPAIVRTNNHKAWYLNGKPHREDGPAIEYANGGKSWYLNGKFHREDGPAIEFSNGTKQWYLNGLRHHVDGPAIEWATGGKSWYFNDKLYRVDEAPIEWNSHRECGCYNCGAILKYTLLDIKISNTQLNLDSKMLILPVSKWIKCPKCKFKIYL